MVIGLCAGGATIVYGPSLFAVAQSNSWNIPAIYSAVFNISTVYTAFLFSLYTYILTSDSRFIAAAEKSGFFKQAVSLAIRAMLMGALVSIVTVPFLLIEPTTTMRDAVMWWVAAWVGLAVWSFFLFVQAASILSLFAKREG